MLLVLVPLPFGLSFLSGMPGLGLAFRAIPILGLVGYDLISCLDRDVSSQHPRALGRRGHPGPTDPTRTRESAMKKIEVLGPGCNNCVRLEKNAREAVATAGIAAEITKVTDYAEIMTYGIMSTPGLVIDGKVVSYGRVPSADDIVPWLAE
ncbi:MAG: thioredoxin family protein [Candidatus Limnocylindrales bacterium]